MGDAYSASKTVERDRWIAEIDGALGLIPLIGGYLADAFKSLIHLIYDPQIDDEYNMGVNVGDQAYSDYFGKITGALNDAKAYSVTLKQDADRMISDIQGRVDSLKSQISNIQASINDATSKVSQLNSLMDTAQGDILNLKTRVASLEKTGVPMKKSTSPLFPLNW